MANLPETASYDTGVYQLETTDPVQGGVDGISNAQAKALANRTAWLKQNVDALNTATAGSAPLNSPTFTGTPQGPTAALGTNTDQFATTKFAQAIVHGVLTKSIAGSSNVTLTADEAAYGILNLTGAITANIAVIVPNTTHSFIVRNATTGAFSVTVKTAAGSGVTVGQGLNREVFCDGASVRSSTDDFTDAALLGSPTAPTPAVGDASTRIATMAALFAAADGMATVNVAGGADVTLTQAQYGSAILNLTGTPTAAINLVFPPQTGQWIVKNGQGGTFNITAKTSAGGSVGVSVPQGVAVVLYSDGTNIGLASASGTSAFRIVPITGVTGTTLTVGGGYTVGGLFLGKNGGLLQAGDYSATNGSTITLTSAAVSTDKFEVYVFSSFTIANAVQKSGDTMSGPLLLSSGSTAITQAYSDSSTSIATTAHVHSAIANSRGVVPQTVLCGAADTNGYPVFFVAGSGLSCNLIATTPLLISFAAGYSLKGLTTYIGQISANVIGAWSGLPASTTSYLYFERDVSTGAITFGFSTLQPLYQDATPSSPATGQHWFSPATMVMQYYNGSAWVAVQRVFAGRAIAGTSSINGLTVYAFKGRYLSQPFALAYSASSVVTHAIGMQPRIALAYLVNVVSELGYGVGNRVLMPYADNTSAVCSLSSDTLNGSFNLSSGGLAIPQIGTGARAGITTANWNVQTYFDRGW